MTNLILPQHLATNKAFTRVFQPKKLSFGLIAAFKGYPEGPIPNMDDHLELAKMADEGKPPTIPLLRWYPDMW